MLKQFFNILVLPIQKQLPLEFGEMLWRQWQTNYQYILCEFISTDFWHSLYTHCVGGMQKSSSLCSSLL